MNPSTIRPNRFHQFWKFLNDLIFRQPASRFHLRYDKLLVDKEVYVFNENTGNIYLPITIIILKTHILASRTVIESMIITVISFLFFSLLDYDKIYYPQTLYRFFIFQFNYMIILTFTTSLVWGVFERIKKNSYQLS